MRVFLNASVKDLFACVFLRYMWFFMICFDDFMCFSHFLTKRPQLGPRGLKSREKLRGGGGKGSMPPF